MVALGAEEKKFAGVVKKKNILSLNVAFVLKVVCAKSVVMNIEAGAKQEMIGKYYETRTQMPGGKAICFGWSSKKMKIEFEVLPDFIPCDCDWNDFYNAMPEKCYIIKL